MGITFCEICRTVVDMEGCDVLQELQDTLRPSKTVRYEAIVVDDEVQDFSDTKPVYEDNCEDPVQFLEKKSESKVLSSSEAHIYEDSKGSMEDEKATNIKEDSEEEDEGRERNDREGDGITRNISTTSVEKVDADENFYENSDTEENASIYVDVDAEYEKAGPENKYWGAASDHESTSRPPTKEFDNPYEACVINDQIVPIDPALSFDPADAIMLLDSQRNESGGLDAGQKVTPSWKNARVRQRRIRR